MGFTDFYLVCRCACLGRCRSKAASVRPGSGDFGHSKKESHKRELETSMSFMSLSVAFIIGGMLLGVKRRAETVFFGSDWVVK